MKTLNKEHTLSYLHPEIAKLWHPTKNDTLTPDQIGISYKKQIWWLCSAGHEWQVWLVSLLQGRGCPTCRIKAGSIVTLFPHLAAEWHPTKNGDLSPDRILHKSMVRVWWRCQNGHEWQASLNHRTMENSDCAFCMGKRFHYTQTLIESYPDLAAQWHPTKNPQYSLPEVKASLSKSVWWKCSLGHEWSASVNLRVKGSDCPYCYGRYPSPENNLLVSKPQMAAQWHPTKNGTLKPQDVLPGSPMVVHWICSKGHEWSVSCQHRVRSGCPTCARETTKLNRGRVSLQEARPDLLAEWHWEKNQPLTPKDLSIGSKIKPWWICELGHEWEAAVKKRNAGTNCPYCSGRYPSPENNLASVRPDLAAQWHPTLNGTQTPTDFTPGSHARVWWLCNHGHAWQAPILGRKNGLGCPECSRIKKAKKGTQPL